jgi:uncharacterized membrane protein (UPF0127 family)
MLRALSLALLLALAVAGCKQPDPVRDFSSTEVTLPGGQVISSEVESDPVDMARGMMFRDSLPQGRGMLFVHSKPGKYAYWMYQVKIPLDIIWMDQGKYIVEISANTPPCRSTSARQCPNYGGHEDAMYVLELGGGMAAKYSLAKGKQIQFF